MPYSFVTASVSKLRFIDWFRGTSVRNLSAFGEAPPHYYLISLPLLSAPIFKHISENKTLTAGIILGLVIIFAINYTTSPWRKLPPGPRRLPILGNVLQLRDKSWLLSKDCKEHFSESPYYVHGDRISWVHVHSRRSYVSRRCWTTHRCVQ